MYQRLPKTSIAGLKTIGDFMRTMDNDDMAWFLTKEGIECPDREDCADCDDLDCPYKVMLEFLNTHIIQKTRLLS
jgi:hypothetical protein